MFDFQDAAQRPAKPLPTLRESAVTKIRACSVKFLIEIILPKKKMLDSSYFPNYSMWRLRFLLNNRILLELSQNSVL